MRYLTNALTRMRHPFLRGEQGSVVVEAVIVLPIFLWAYVGLFAYWDTFRSLNMVQKAAFTVSDMISREQTGLSTPYVDGMSQVLNYLIDCNQDARMRLSSVTWNDVNARFEIHWSVSPHGTMTPLTTQTLQGHANEIPKMAPGDFVIILEVEVDYQPSFGAYLPDQTFRQFIVTRPRFLPCLSLDAVACPLS